MLKKVDKKELSELWDTKEEDEALKVLWNMSKLSKLEIELFECLIDEIKNSKDPSEKTLDLLYRFEYIAPGVHLYLEMYAR